MKTDVTEVEYEFSTIFGMINTDNNYIVTLENFKKALKTNYIKEIIKNYGGLPVTNQIFEMNKSNSINIKDIIGICTKIEQRGIYTYGTIRFNDLSKVPPLNGYKIGVNALAMVTNNSINPTVAIYSDIKIINLYVAPSENEYKTEILMEGK